MAQVTWLFGEDVIQLIPLHLVSLRIRGGGHETIWRRGQFQQAQLCQGSENATGEARFEGGEIRNAALVIEDGNQVQNIDYYDTFGH